MKTKRRINEKTIEKAFNYLEELHHVLTITDVVNLTKLSTVHKVSKTYGTLLLSNNLLIKTKNGAMKWATIEPSREMAIELVRRANEYQTNSLSKQKENKEQVAMNFTKKEISKTVIPAKENKTKKTFNLFWGLLKFDY
ncbi:MAG: hypothetical protein IZT56_13025 [Bacteroidetes bacterium]|jgi:hypothetical protein|nr:hypothetical protein [Bacteroidota bacterium]